MKKILLVVLLAIGAWWYFVGGRTLSEEAVRDFYRLQEHATLSRDPAALCSLLDKEFAASGMTTSGGSHADKGQTCDGYHAMYQGFESLGEKMGGILQLDYGYDIHSIQLSPNKKSATVDISYSLDVAGSIMNIRSRATETLIRRNGKILMLRSEENNGIATR